MYQQDFYHQQSLDVQIPGAEVFGHQNDNYPKHLVVFGCLGNMLAMILVALAVAVRDENG